MIFISLLISRIGEQGKVFSQEGSTFHIQAVERVGSPETSQSCTYYSFHAVLVNSVLL